MARPEKYSDEYAKQAKVACERMGATDADLAELFDVSIRTINYWKVNFPEFGDAVKVGKSPADERVKMSLYHRACGYSHPDVDIKMFEGQIIKTETIKHYPPDTTAAIFWLKNRLPDEFRSNPESADDEDSDITIRVTRATKPEKKIADDEND